jgi:hypothetical protein
MSHNVGGYIDTGAGEEAEAFDAGNYTSNCSRMWACAIPGTFNEPEMWLGDLDGKPCGECVEILARAMGHMDNEMNRVQYEAMNPKNGWGVFESAREFLRRIFAGCQKHPLARLHVSR